MKRQVALVVAAALAALAAHAEEPEQALARGKLEADLGHYTVAAEAFASVAGAPQATVPQRWEALVRLGVARRDAGDAKGSVAAFEEAFRSYGKDPEALRFLLEAVGSALPGRERWEQVWKDVVVGVDRRVPERPVVRVAWPGLPFGLCPCSGAPVSLDLKDGDLQDVFRMFADTTRLNVVVHPGVGGKVTYRARQVPWDEALERLLAPNGFVARLDGNVVEIGRSQNFGEKRSFTGAAISFDYQDKDLVEALREVAAHAHASVEVPEGVMGRVFFKLDEVPWDQAFDLLVRLNGLTWTRTGDVIRVEPRRRAPSR
jgi:type II secretory pathway component GspD/PulD (secretin)